MINTREVTVEEKRYYVRNRIPVIAGTYSGAVRIIGGGSTMWQDFDKSERLMPGTDTIAVNFAAMVHPKLTHIFSWHHKQLSAIKAWRKAEWPDDDAIYHSMQEHPGIDIVWQTEWLTAVSGLTAVELAWALGYRKIVLVGVPQDGNGYFYKHPKQDNPDIHDKFRINEIFKLHELFGEGVKSFSGKTAQVLGEPSEEWLYGSLKRDNSEQGAHAAVC